ncbi:MAG TPA: cell division protein FtsL [Candidatus Koribacter sp.]
MATAAPAQATLWASPQTSAPRVVVRPGTPEIFFTKSIDNSRLVKVADPVRRREMGIFGVTLAVMFALVMMYGWQHFSSIEYGYKIEQVKAQCDQLTEANRTLRLEQATLRSPDRIDAMARQLGMQAPQAGQVQRLDSDGLVGSNSEVMARMSTVSVISAP